MFVFTLLCEINGIHCIERFVQEFRSLFLDIKNVIIFFFWGGGGGGQWS